MVEVEKSFLDKFIDGQCVACYFLCAVYIFVEVLKYFLNSLGRIEDHDDIELKKCAWKEHGQEWEDKYECKLRDSDMRELRESTYDRRKK